MAEVRTSIDIDAPVEDVYAFVMDAERLGEWVTIHRGLLEHSDGHMKQRLCLRGATFKVDWELDTAKRPSHVVWKGRGPARSKAETEYRLADNGKGGTRFDYRNEFRAPLGPLGAVASSALVGGLPEREANASLQKLKAILEG
ncbi:SRPBCC family protein [Conexibacter sp. SYSU D00693]|uniref:SRPBCC family protein n=1 Tax=Conexibacter sp. SYSU D00693 TaxID=2812560 RepID=UPI00196BA706|nr:SRPBCC family protein [Conexibacter sp. SYSU D00693]